MEVRRAFDVELAVFLAVGFAGGEADHAGDGVGALDVAVVEAFDFHGGLGEREERLETLELLEGLGRGLAGGEGALVGALLAVGLDVAERELEQPPAVAARGGVLLQVVGRQVGHGDGEDDLGGGALGLLVELWDEGG